MLNRAEAAPSSATPNQNHSAAAGKAQTRPPAGIVEQPAAVLAFPTRNSNYARVCVASLDLSPGCRITANTIADFGAVHSRPQKSRHIQAGDCAAYPGAAAIRRKRPGPKVCLKTVRNHIAEVLAAADAAGGGVERRRTVRTNTYVFKLSEQQKAPGIRAEIAENCTLFCTPVCTPIEPRTEEDQDQDQVQDQKNCARDPSTATTTTTTTAVRTGNAPTGRDPGPSCAPETSPPPRDPSTATATTTKAVRTNADSTGRDPGPSCAPETSPPARRTPANAKPATARQLEYVAFPRRRSGHRPAEPVLAHRTNSRPRHPRPHSTVCAVRRERRDRRCQPVPSTVQAQSDRTDRTAPIRGCPASARRHRIDVLELALEQWRPRTDPATVQAWEREIAALTAAAITEEDRHRDPRPPIAIMTCGAAPPTAFSDHDATLPDDARRRRRATADAAGADDADLDPDPDAAAIRRCPSATRRAAFASRSATTYARCNRSGL